MNLKSTYPKFLFLAFLLAANITSVNATPVPSSEGNLIQIQPNSFANDTNTRILLPKNTLIKVQLEKELHSNQKTPIETVHFKTIGDLRNGAALLLPSNTIVCGKVIKLKRSSAWDFPGRIEITFTAVNVPGNIAIPVTGSLRKEGKKPNFFTRYSLFGVLIKGKPAIIEKGTVVELRTTQDIFLSPLPSISLPTQS